MKKLLANENFPLASVLLLRKLGYDVTSIGENNPSISDREVMMIAQEESRTILTFDRDYGELIFKFNYRPEAGVIYLRLTNYLPEEPAEIVHKLLTTNIDTERTLSVFDGENIRQRKY